MGTSNLFGAKGPDKPHLVRGTGGLAGEVSDLRDDIDESFQDLEDNGGYLYTDEWTDPPAADPDYLMTARATQVTEDIWTSATAEATAAWLADTELVPPRNLTVTGNAHANIEATTLTITGFVRDKLGVLVAQTDTIAIANDEGATKATTRAFSTVTNATMPAIHLGTGGTFTFGFGEIFGLSKPIKTRAGLTAPLREVEAGSVVTTGTFTTAAAQPPTGTYLPATVADAANDYALTYEVDPDA
jgi:hypothetical protein